MMPSGWSETLLKDLVVEDRKITYGIVQPGAFDPNGIPLIRGKDYSFGWVPLDEFFRVSPEVDRPYKRSKVRPGDLLLTIVGAGTGNTAIVPPYLNDANITQTTARIAVDATKAHPMFVHHYLNSETNTRLNLKKHIKGQAQPGLNLADVEIFKILLPPLNEQEKIAKILSAWDEAIEKIDRQIALETQILNGMIPAILFENSDEISFEGLFSVVNDKSKQLKSSSYLDEGEFPIVDQGQSLICGFTNDPSKIVKDIPLIIFGDHTREIKFIDFEFAPGADGTQLLKTTEGINIRLGYYALRSIKIPSLGYARHFKAVKEARYRIPKKENRERAVSILSTQDNKIAFLENYRKAIATQKHGLMQQLLTGRKRVKV